MRRGPICKWQPKPSFIFSPWDEKCYPVLAHVSASYPDLTGRLPTCYSPVRRSFHKHHPEGFRLFPALDLHVLGTPPAFVLSQDQTLHKVYRSWLKWINHWIILASLHLRSTKYNHWRFMSIKIFESITEKTRRCFFISYSLFCSVFKEQSCSPLAEATSLV